MKRTVRRKVGLWILSVMAMLLWTNITDQVSAEPDGSITKSNQDVYSGTSITQLNEEAAALYRQALENNIEEVRGSVLRISSSLEHISFEGRTTVEGIHALSEAIVEVKEAVNKVRSDDHSLQQSSAKLRLATDSLANPAKPLWLQYYKIVKNDLDALSTAVIQSQNGEVLANRYAVLEEHYETIRPAALIRREPQEIAQLDAWLSHIKGLTNVKQPNLAQLKEMAAHGEQLVNQLFGREKDESAFVPFVQGPDRRSAGLLIGSVIIATLSYAGYRKYRALQQDIFPYQR